MQHRWMFWKSCHTSDYNINARHSNFFSKIISTDSSEITAWFIIGRFEGLKLQGILVVPNWSSSMYWYIRFTHV